ncbi:MAG: hypothetical protein JW779_12970 [Candidatus Thorarchaeota archaeon]|nr:hypothetical protein [Candidatus Thorarchaeota archaeon]
MTRVLIVGIHTFDSGKTHLAIELGRAFINAGRSVEYFKPISGHNYWYNYQHTLKCLEIGQLVSKDAMLVKETLGIDSDLRLMNPIHSLFVPSRIDRPLETIPNSLGLSGSTSILTMQRFSQPLSDEIDTTVLIAESLVEEEHLLIGFDEVGKLTHETSVSSADSLEAFQEFEMLYFDKYVTSSFSKISRSTDVVIIEAFNDAAWPWEALESVDHVFVVCPGHIFSYDPERFRKAAFLMKRGNLPIREVTFGRMSDLLKPSRKLEIRPQCSLSSSDLYALGID